MKTILKIGKTIVKGLLTGLNELKVNATPAFIKYLEALEELAMRGIVYPFVLGTLAFFGYGIATTSVDVLQYCGWTGKFWSWIALLLGKTEGLWATALALAGIVSFVYVWFCGVLAAPIGVIVHASSPSTRSVPSAPVTVSWGGLAGSILTEIRDARIGITNALQAGVTEYVWQVKFGLTFIGATYFFAALFPGLRAVILLCILGALILTAMRGFKSPTASVLRFAVCVALLWCVAGRRFPVLNPFVSLFGTSPEKLTMKEVGATAKGTWDYINVFIPGNWTKPAFWLMLLVVAPFVYVAYGTILGWAKKTTAGASADSHGATAPVAHDTSHGGGGAKLFDRLVVVAIVVFICWCIIGMYNRWKNWDTLRDMKIEAAAELHRIREEARQATPAPTTPTSVASATPTSVEPQIWCGLKNPTKHIRTLTSTNWCEDMPKPWGMWVKFSPSSIADRLGVRVNGKKELLVEADGSFTFPSEATSFAFKLQSGDPVRTTIGVGNKVNGN